MKKILKISLIAIASACLFGCGDDLPEKLLTFHNANNRGVAAGKIRDSETMPVSGFSVIVDSDQFMYSGDILEVKLGKVTMPDGAEVFGFMFYCDQRGSMRLYQASAGNMGGFIVVKWGGEPIALRKIDTVINGGVLFAVCEMPPETDLHKIVAQMNDDLKKVNEFKSSMRR